VSLNLLADIWENIRIDSANKSNTDLFESGIKQH